MSTMIHDKRRAKFNLAVNAFCRLQDLGRRPYDATLAHRLGVHPSQIQRILEQTSSADWRFVFNLAEMLDVSVEQLAANPSKRSIRRYLEKYPEKTLESANVA